MSIREILWSNWGRYDWIIFVLGAVNAGVFVYTLRLAKDMYRKVYSGGLHALLQWDLDSLLRKLNSANLEELSESQNRTEHWYAFFVNLTAIFPLLGILGTVISLLPMVASLSDMHQNFFAALTSTFWGLVFAIAFKLADGYLSSRVEINAQQLGLLLEQRDKIQRRKEAEREEALR